MIKSTCLVLCKRQSDTSCRTVRRIYETADFSCVWQSIRLREYASGGQVGSPKSRSSLSPANAMPMSWRVRLCRTARTTGTVNGSPKAMALSLRRSDEMLYSYAIKQIEIVHFPYFP